MIYIYINVHDFIYLIVIYKLVYLFKVTFSFF